MRGPISYVGGKNRLAKLIISKIPVHKAYVEPFAGGAQVFFHKPRSAIEVLNDLDGELVNFYRVCQSHYEELVRYTGYMLVSREWFKWLELVPPETLTDIQRATRYLYLQKNAYGGRVTRKAYAIHVVSCPGFNPETLETILAETHQRLARVQLEHLPYDQVVKLYDRPTTFFYLDPPYYDIRLYRHNLEHEDFVRMVELLRGIKGRFLLSINDHPEIRKLFAGFHIETAKITYSLHSKVGKRHQELLISNFDQTKAGSSRDGPAG